MSKVSSAEVEHLAKLARLQLSGDETKRLVGELEDILSYVSKVNELAAKILLEPVTDQAVLREDKVSKFTPTDLLLAQSDTSDNNLIKVPPVFG